MKAVVLTKSGPPEVLQVRDVDKPIPRDHEVLIKIHAATVTRGDAILRRLNPLVWVLMRLFMGFKRKKVLGHELAGMVESVGKDVKLFKPGDEVFGTTSGLAMGSYAEYVCLPEDGKYSVLAPKPSNLTFEQAAAVPIGAMTALHFLEKANIQNGQEVLVYGASGSVGSYGVQFAKHFGAHVTGVCSTANLELVRSLGAGRVIDYTEEDVTESGPTYDVIFNAVGKISKSRLKKALKQNGVYVSVIGSMAKETHEGLVFIKELCESGEIKPVIDRRYEFEQIPEAHRYVDQGHKKGNVVITVPYAN
jgi:NADPH:quinone reductase-like Zn-dependent oxidoreductase